MAKHPPTKSPASPPGARVICVFIVCPLCSSVVALPPGAESSCACGTRITLLKDSLGGLRFEAAVPERKPADLVIARRVPLTNLRKV